MGQPVVHFEIVGRDVEKLLNADGVGIGGGMGAAPEGYPGHVTFYVEVPDGKVARAKAASLGE